MPPWRRFQSANLGARHHGDASVTQPNLNLQQKMGQRDSKIESILRIMEFNTDAPANALKQTKWSRVKLSSWFH